MILNEEWRPVVGYEGLYEVSNRGGVRSVRSGLTLTTIPTAAEGYCFASLHRQGYRRTRPVHVLVAEAFIGPRPAGLMCCHGNDIKWDNRVENLRWDTRAANAADWKRNQGWTRETIDAWKATR